MAALSEASLASRADEAAAAPIAACTAVRRGLSVACAWLRARRSVCVARPPLALASSTSPSACFAISCARLRACAASASASALA
eukprot:scaffold27966_cov64-Phaeocystis_antarctica.AAC.10